MIRLSVQAGAPASLSLTGEGKVAAALRELALGEWAAFWVVTGLSSWQGAATACGGDGSAARAVLHTPPCAPGLRPGEELPPLKLVLRDALGNPVDSAAAAAAPPITLYAAAHDEGGAVVRCGELVVAAQQEVVEGGILLTGLRITGSEEARSAKQGGWVGGALRGGAAFVFFASGRWEAGRSCAARMGLKG